MNGAVPNGDSLAKINKPVMMYNGAKDTRPGTKYRRSTLP